ncbi:MAG: alpha-galactosidase [Ignavibacteriae bacterium]|nr:alpha-galactosidase [Ignavibacteriota bacterium]
MSDSFNRREFIKKISVTSASLAFINPLNSNFFSSENPQISNNFFSIYFDEKTGRFNIHQNYGEFSISNATVRANLNFGKISISQKNYSHILSTKNIDDKLGKGKKLEVYSKDLNGELDFQTSFSLYENWNNIIIEAKCKNVSSKNFNIKSIEPICAIEEIGSSLSWINTSKVLTNGAMYYDAGMIHEFGKPYKEPTPYGPTKGGKISSEFNYPADHRVRSWWNVGFFRGYDKEGLVCGFVDNHTGLGEIVVSKYSQNNISIYTESVFAPGTILKTGKEISSNRFMINISQNPYTALEDFAKVTGILNSVRTNSTINGWCNWFYTYEHITEDEVVCNAEFVSKNLKQYGLEYIQIDEGFQRYHGDWEGNTKFPHGMKWLAEKIKYYGLKPGLWIAPYLVSEPVEIFQKNQDWFLKDKNGNFLRVGPWPSLDTDWAKNENPKRYCLDITHPEAEKWFYNLFDKIGNVWGYEMIKIDFVAWSIFSAHHFNDLTATPAQVYRKGFEIIRNAIGNEIHINDCGPGNVSVGFIDSMRIELDQNYGYSKAAWQQYFLDSSSSAPAAAKRYYFHKNAWVNDADHICINHLSIPQAQAAATIIGLSGGNIISGDRLSDLDFSRLEILKKILPQFGEAAKPVDLFDSDKQNIFITKIKKSFAEWNVVGIFNPTEDLIEKEITFERLWLNPKTIYLGYDFWMEKFVGEISNSLKIKLLPQSVTLLSLHEKTGNPQFISTDRHILQGAHEVENIFWSSEKNTISGTSLGILKTSHNVAIYIPGGQNWVQGRNSIHHDFENYSLKFMDDNIVRVHVKFEKSEKVNWEINFNESFK